MFQTHLDHDHLVLLEAALSAQADPLFVVAPDGRIEWRNPAAAKLSAAPAVAPRETAGERALDEARASLVAAVSHELKTPLTSLRMAVYLLLEKNLGGLTAAQRELLETARDDADRLLRSLNNLLDLAR